MSQIEFGIGRRIARRPRLPGGQHIAALAPNATVHGTEPTSRVPAAPVTEVERLSRTVLNSM